VHSKRFITEFLKEAIYKMKVGPKEAEKEEISSVSLAILPRRGKENGSPRACESS
jgi:hypothetical protein